VAQVVRRLQVPHLNDWYSALTTLAEQLFPLRQADSRAHSPFFDRSGPFSPALVAAVHDLKRLREGDQLLHQAMLESRNRDAHGGTWSEADCRLKLDRWVPVLERALECFSCLAGLNVLRACHGGFIRLRGARREFAAEAEIDPQLAAAFAESALVARSETGAALALYPLFVGTDSLAPGYQEDLLAYYGHGRRRMVHLGVSERVELEESLGEYRRLLDDKVIDPGYQRHELRPWLVTTWAREITRGTIDDLCGVKYFPDFYRERIAIPAAPGSGVDDAAVRWLEHGREAALLIAAEAGSGKTSLLCRLAERLLSTEDGEPSPDCVLLLLGAEVPAAGAIGSQRLFGRIRTGLGLASGARGFSSFAELLEAWETTASEDLDHERRRLVILVDAVNEAAGAKDLLGEIADVAAAVADANRRAGRRWVRLAVSLRHEWLGALLSRGQDQESAGFLDRPGHFAHFQGQAEREVPYLALRPFAVHEAADAYERARTSLPAGCTTPWEALAPPIQTLLSKPLLVLLFHQTFAGREAPTALEGEGQLWSTWLDRTFDPARAGAGLADLALTLAGECLDQGLSQIPPELAAEWRDRWRTRLGHDPATIAANLDDLERLADAGILRQSAAGGWDFVSDSLAEQLFWRELKRRRPEADDEGLTAGLDCPWSPLRDGALVLAGVALWERETPATMVPLLSTSAAILGRTLARIAPRGEHEKIKARIPRFSAQLEKLTAAALASDRTVPAVASFQRALAWWACDELQGRAGAVSALRALTAAAHSALERLLQLEPENAEYLRDLSISYDQLSDLDRRSDPVRAREGYAKGLEIAHRLVRLEPGNVEYLRDLSISHNKIADLDEDSDPTRAREGYAKGLEIREQLLQLEPDNVEYLADLSFSYNRLADLDKHSDTVRAREGYAKSLEIDEQLLQLDPDNIQYLSDLSVSCNKLARLDQRSDPTRAREGYAKGLEIAGRLARLEPDNIRYLRDLSIAYANLAGLDQRSDPTRAREGYAKSFEIADRLVRLDPDNREYLRGLSISYNNLADLDRRGDPALARESYARGLAIAEQLVRLEPDNVQFLGDLPLWYERLADLDARTHPAATRNSYLKNLQIRQRLVQLEPDNMLHLRNLSMSYGKLADLDRRSDPVRAREGYAKGLEIAHRLVRLEPDNVEFLRDLSIAYDRIADLDEDSNPARARDGYAKALEIRERLLRLDPENREYLDDLSISYDNLASLDRPSEPARAREGYSKGLEIREQLVRLEPENAQYLRALSISYHNLADLDRQSDPAQAFVGYTKGLAIREQLAHRDPDNLNYLRSLSISYARLADLAASTSPTRAREGYAKKLEIAERLVRLEPGNVTYLGDLAIAYANLADLDRRVDQALARERYTMGLEIYQQLIRVEPTNPSYRRNLSVWYERIAQVDERGDPARAREGYRKAFEVLSPLISREPAPSVYLEPLATLHERLARLDLASDPPNARRAALESLEIRLLLLGREPDNLDYGRSLASSRRTLADLDRLENPAAASAGYAASLAEVQQLLAREPEHLELRYDLATCLEKLATLDAEFAPTRAREGYGKSLEILRDLLEPEPDHIEWREALDRVEGRLAALATPRGTGGG
jgi:Flp pilus assembly protein TadD